MCVLTVGCCSQAFWKCLCWFVYRPRPCGPAWNPGVESGRWILDVSTMPALPFVAPWVATRAFQQVSSQYQWELTYGMVWEHYPQHGPREELQPAS